MKLPIEIIQSRIKDIPRAAVRNAIVLLAILCLLWFVPWILVLHTGALIYFPYEADGSSRFMRITGPLAASLIPAVQWESNIPAACGAAVVAAEDTRFHEHNGVDWNILFNLGEVNEKRKKQGRRIVGGSTITQQLVKNAFLSRDRSILRKSREITGALIANQILSKETILSWYLNIVEFGPDIYGIEAAAKHYFNKDAAALTNRECILLASILPSPRKWGRSLKDGGPSAFLLARHDVVARRMRILGLSVNATNLNFPLTPSAIPLEVPDLPTPPPDLGMDNNQESDEEPIPEASNIDEFAPIEIEETISPSNEETEDIVPLMPSLPDVESSDDIPAPPDDFATGLDDLPIEAESTP